MDEDGLITDWNRSAEVTFGWSQAEAVGRLLAETIVPPAFRAAHTEGLKRFLAGGEASLKCRPADARDDEIGRLKEKVGDLTMANELLGVKIERLETSRPLARRRSRR